MNETKNQNGFSGNNNDIVEWHPLCSRLHALQLDSIRFVSFDCDFFPLDLTTRNK